MNNNPYGLYDYQLDALSRMKCGCILCGGVGSGKSRTALSYYFKENGGYFDSEKYVPMCSDSPGEPDDLYIITTAHKRDTLEWEHELIPFLLGEGSIYSNYVKIDSWNNIKKYIDVKNAFFIFDEQRVIGNGSWVQSFLKITKNNAWILLSATPGDTWSDYIPVFIANGFYKNRTEFNREHVIYKHIPNISYPVIDRYVSQGKLIKHRSEILVTMDYKRPAETHDITKQVDYDKNLYKAVMQTRWNPWEDEPIETASALCYALRKVVNQCTGKKLALLEILEEHPKAIIFYNYNYELDILKALPYAQGTQIGELNGNRHDDIPTSNRWVYLVNYMAGAEGWNCITSDTIIFYSQNYSYRIMTQSKGRIDRVNTPFTDLYYYHLKTRCPIDVAIDQALTKKKKFNESSFAEKVQTRKKRNEN